MVLQWRVNTLFNRTMPNRLYGCAVTGFRIRCYAAGIHIDPGDLGFTAALRAHRAEHEPRLPKLVRMVGGKHHGVIMQQPSGAITSWQASVLYHGSSIDLCREESIPVDGDSSVGVALV
jgi:hypothetical protein